MCGCCLKNGLLREDPASPKIYWPILVSAAVFFATEMQDRMRIAPNLLKNVRHPIHGGTVCVSKRTTNWRSEKKHEKNNWLSTRWHKITSIYYRVKMNSTKKCGIASPHAHRQYRCNLCVSFTAQIVYTKSTTPKCKWKKQTLQDVASSNYPNYYSVGLNTFNQCHEIHWNLHMEP